MSTKKTTSAKVTKRPSKTKTATDAPKKTAANGGSRAKRSSAASKASTAPKRRATKPVESKPPTHDEIAREAYLLWMAQGCPPGQDVATWLEAERRLTRSG